MAFSIGISLSEFKHLTPKKLDYALEGYQMAQKRESEIRDIENWQLGVYVSNALVSTVGNMFQKKGAQPHKYPEKPLFAYANNEHENEVDVQAERDKLVAMLDRMKANWDANHKRETDMKSEVNENG